MTLLQFHCLHRPEEARQTRWRDLVVLTPAMRARFPGVAALAGVGKPKTRRLPTHGTRQFVIITDEVLAAFLGRVLSTVPEQCLDEVLWPGAVHVPARLWKYACRELGAASLQIPWSGLRGGGATDYFLRTQDIEGLRRRGRWSNIRTLERYVQEATFIMGAQRFEPQVGATLDRLAALSGEVFFGWGSPAAAHEHRQPARQGRVEDLTLDPLGTELGLGAQLAEEAYSDSGSEQSESNASQGEAAADWHL